MRTFWNQKVNNNKTRYIVRDFVLYIIYLFILIFIFVFWFDFMFFNFFIERYNIKLCFQSLTNFEKQK